MAMDRAFIVQRMNAYERLLRLDKPIGALLLLWPTLWALWFAAYGWPPLDILLVFVLGTFVMRSAGCAINDFADRNFDPHVERTRGRPLAAREIAPREALALAGLLALCAFALVMHLNRMAVLLSFAGLAIAASYPFAKRFLPMPQLYLGVAFGFGIPLAYAALTKRLPLECWLLLAANICYSFAYDTEYAMVDRDDDARLGVHSSALVLGRWDVAGVMASYGLMLALLVAAGVITHRGIPYYAGLAVAAGMMVYHWRLIRDRTREGCFKAFLHNNWVGAAIFAGLALSYPFNPSLT
jgi:4-hydroxybenzoate polyprenyltransferase